MDINVSPEEMIDELLSRNAQLTVELAAANILIRKLRENQADGVSLQPELELEGVSPNGKK